MPGYEYQCDQCGHRFELIRKFSDPAVDTCPKCGGHVQKLISASAFQLKGSGWYLTDYARKDSSGAGKSESSSKESGKDSGKDSTADKSGTSPDSKSDSGKEAKADSKSEAKSDSKKDDSKPSSSSSDTGSSPSKT